MKRVRAFIGGVLFSASVVSPACAGSPEESIPQDAEVAVTAPAPLDAPLSLDLSAGVTEASGADCGCADLIDEDADGVCDRAEEGSCRRAARGRCPCGMACPGGGCEPG